jgi:hypothetical protein
MGKRGSTVIGATAGAATKKAKTADADTSVVGNWVVVVSSTDLP